MTTPKTAAERKANQRKREAERLAALGHQVMPFEMYQRTAEALDRLCAAGGLASRRGADPTDPPCRPDRTA
ncbi:hypothetical protein ACQKEF_09915 [Pseudomonas oryzihabitans]|uniref:hypothetical protein n=1 Tax=Pseudomonas oryzihabitans TaxID=47885 RepID=UPI003D081740